MNSQDAQFDWVKARAACSAAVMFEKLKAQTENDVAARQAMLPASSEYSFRFAEEVNAFCVLCEANTSCRTIKFKLVQDKILVVYPNGHIVFEAVPALSDDGECRLQVSGKERELWQVRMEALQNLFFTNL